MTEEFPAAREADVALDREHAIGDVARMSGVTSRTLRHYDTVGLLRPSSTSPDGRRWYGRRELLRLQRILVLRAVGLPLDEIGRICDDERDEAEALRDHLGLLREERRRLAAVIATVEHTLTKLDEGADMTTDDVFAGLPGYDAEQQKRYEAEAVERWGQDVIDESKARTGRLTPDEAQAFMAEHDAIARELGSLHASGAAPDSDAAQDLVTRHYAWILHSWTPNAEAYRGLAQMYVDDERLRRNYDVHGEGTAQFLRDAIEVFAEGLPQE